MTIECFKCGTTEGNIIKHHISYNPEVIVDCCKHCHTLIHNRVRRNGLCPISPEDVKKISIKSSKMRNYKKQNTWLETIVFSQKMLPNVRLFEELFYNTHTGNITWCSRFQATNNKKLLEV